MYATAIISVYDKSKLEEFARGLSELADPVTAGHSTALNPLAWQ